MKCQISCPQGRWHFSPCGVAKVYIPYVQSIGGSGGMLPQENFVKLYAKRVLLRPCLASNLICSAILSKQNATCTYSLGVSDRRLRVT